MAITKLTVGSKGDVGNSNGADLKVLTDAVIDIVEDGASGNAALKTSVDSKASQTSFDTLNNTVTDPTTGLVATKVIADAAKATADSNKLIVEDAVIGNAALKTAVDLKANQSVIDESLFSKKSPAGLLNSKLLNDAGDAVILVNSDSTGNSTDEWVYLLAEKYAADYPAFSVDYYLWDDVAGDYAAAVAVQAGTGSRALSIYNAAISGSKPDYVMGDKFANAISNVPSADLYIINHGHNVLNSYPDTDSANRSRYLWISNIMDVCAVHSSAGVLAVAQNPRRDDDQMERMYSATKDVCGLINITCADVYSKFIALNKDASLYSDNVHPSQVGSEMFRDVIFESLKGYDQDNSQGVLIDVSGFNIVPNGDFSLFSGALPDDFTASNCTASKDLTNIDGKNGYSVKLTSTASGSQSYINYQVPSVILSRLKGKRVTLSARVFVGASQQNECGRIGLLTNSNTSNQYALTGTGRDGFNWRVVSCYVSPSDTYMNIRLYANTTTVIGEATFDRVILSVGNMPKDVF